MTTKARGGGIREESTRRLVRPGCFHPIDCEPWLRPDRGRVAGRLGGAPTGTDAEGQRRLVRRKQSPLTAHDPPQPFGWGSSNSSGRDGSMKKKLLTGLAPLVVIAAFLVIPAASQAVPHVYKNGVIQTEGKKLRFIAWSTFTFTNPSVFGTSECHHAFEGFLENPTGGGAAVGKLQAFEPYECVDPACIGLGGKQIVFTPEKLPWNSEVTEPEAGVFRMSTGKKGEKGGTGSIEIHENCEGFAMASFFGALAPKILNNGITIGAIPGELEFNASAGELESPDGPGIYEAKVKMQGFAAQELIEAKNP